MTVETIITEYLETHGFDGLCSGECACLIRDLAPCGEYALDCMPGYRTPCDCEHDCEFHVSTTKATEREEADHDT